MLPITGWKRVNDWSIKGPLILAALGVGFFDHVLHLGRLPVAAAIALIIAIIGFREFWNDWRFWITVCLMGFLQVPLVLVINPKIERLGFGFMFTFAILDFFFVAFAISWICAQAKRKM
jgi:hypothetical protein